MKRPFKRTLLIALLLAGCGGSGMTTSTGPNGETIVGNEISVQITGAANEQVAFGLAQRYCRKSDRAARFVSMAGSTSAYDCVKAPA
jgi:hypothetical protein